MAIAKEIALSAEQIDQIMMSEWNMRIATVGPGRRINVTPMWFGWAGVQIAARFGDEATLFRLASQLEEARPWAGKRPVVHIAA